MTLKGVEAMEHQTELEAVEAALRRLIAFVKRPGSGLVGDTWWIDHIEAILWGNPLTVAREDNDA